jgi:hypothetical protein
MTQRLQMMPEANVRLIDFKSATANNWLRPTFVLGVSLWLATIGRKVNMETSKYSGFLSGKLGIFQVVECLLVMFIIHKSSPA